MPRYADSLTIRAARTQYFAENNFGDGGYTATWVKVQAGPVPFYFLNTAARVRAVRFHDLHHVATDYDTTLTGEAEIGAWEIASGCADQYAAWHLNLQAMAIGLVIAPRGLPGLHARALHEELVPGRILRAPFVTDSGRIAPTIEPGCVSPPANFQRPRCFCRLGLAQYALDVFDACNPACTDRRFGTPHLLGAIKTQSQDAI
jgi:hypothetical protein